jgi:hypothetical protein
MMTETGIESRKAVAALPTLRPSGEFEIIIATKRDDAGELAVDHDDDVYADGAVGSQRVTVGCWNHAVECESAPGSAITFETPRDVRAAGRLDVDTPAGAAEFAVWKALGAAAKFSYRYHVLDAAALNLGGRRVRELRRLEITSVDLVQRPAGIGTGIASLKAAGACGGTCPGRCAPPDPLAKARLQARHFATCELCQTAFRAEKLLSTYGSRP